MRTKRCTKCGQTKPTEDFYRRANAPDGLQHWCKRCGRAYSAAHYQSNRDAIIAGVLAHRRGEKRCRACGELKPREEFGLDLRVRDCRRALCRPCERSRLGRPPRRDLAQAQEIVDPGPAVGYWLAGFIDGEGYFGIDVRDVASGHRRVGVRFALTLRADDRPVLDDVCKRLGIGSVTARRRRDGIHVAEWRIASKRDCHALIAVLDRYPLRAKKARDYAIWREAVLLWAVDRWRLEPGDWDRLRDLRDELRAARVFKLDF